MKPHNVNTTEPVVPEGMQFVSNDMFALVDNIRIVCFIMFICSMAVVGLGKIAMRSTFKLKARFSQRVFKRSICRIIFIFAMLMFAKSYIKECKQIVRKHNGGEIHHSGRKLMSVEENVETTEPIAIWTDKQEQIEVSAKELIDTLKGEFEDAKEKLENATEEKQIEESAKQLIDSLRGGFKDVKDEFEKVKEETEKTITDDEKPAWMKKGLFAFDHHDEPTKYSFEGPDMNVNKTAETTPFGGYRINGNKNHHQPFIVFKILGFALLACHLYQLKHLAKSLTALQEMGAQPKKEEKKEQTNQVESEPSIQQVPAEINYSFEEINCEEPEM